MGLHAIIFVRCQMWYNENKWFFFSCSNYSVHLLCCLSSVHIKINIVNFISSSSIVPHAHGYCLTVATLATINNYSIWYEIESLMLYSFSRPSSKFVKALTRHLTEYMPVYTDIVQGMLLDCWPRHCQSRTPERFTIRHIQTYSYFQ